MFLVVDSYEGLEVIGKYTTRREANKCADDFYYDTDGECIVDIYDLNNLSTIEYNALKVLGLI